MVNVSWALGAEAGIVGLLALMPVRSAAQAPEGTVFVGVSVIPMDRERMLSDQTVVVRGNRIIALGPVAQVPLPPGARRIDGRGKFLMPGLGDMHSHISADDEPGLLVALANGITTLRDMGDPTDLLAKRANGVLLPPRIYGVGRLGTCGWNRREVASLAACFTELKTAGLDMLKLYRDVDETEEPAVLDSIVAAAKLAEFPIGGHAWPGVSVERALRIPYKSIEHLQGYPTAVAGYPIWPEGASRDGWQAPPDTVAWLQPSYRLDAAKLRALAEATRRAGTWNAPTLAVAERVQASFSMPAQQRAMQRYREFQFQIVKALHDAGAGLLLSEDMMGGPNAAGFAVHRELELLVQAGLTPYEALATGTRNVAEYLGTQDSAGTVAVGKWADLVLLDGDPLRDIRAATAPAGVMADGRWFSRAELDAHLDSFEAQGCYLVDLRREAAEHRGIHPRSLEAMMTESSTSSCGTS